MPYSPNLDMECNCWTWNPRHLAIFWHFYGHFRVFCGPLKKLLRKSRYEKRTEYVFYARSKRTVRKSVVTFRTKNLVYHHEYFFRRFRSKRSSPPLNAENNHLNKMALRHLGQFWCGRMLFYGNSWSKPVQIPEFCQWFWIWPETPAEILVLHKNSAGAVWCHGGYKRWGLHV